MSEHLKTAPLFDPVADPTETIGQWGGGPVGQSKGEPSPKSTQAASETGSPWSLDSLNDGMIMQ